MAGMGGLNWWTSLQADEETVRFVGRLYRHYAIEGKKELLTKDPLFLTHIQNADFEKQLEGWTLHATEEGSIQAKKFPRYGRIEGRYMGLGRPADPEHIGDTFLWMKRSEQGPNTFSQPIRELQPGRLYSLKMFTCDYQDLIHPRKRQRGRPSRSLGIFPLKESKSTRSVRSMKPIHRTPSLGFPFGSHTTGVSSEPSRQPPKSQFPIGIQLRNRRRLSAKNKRSTSWNSNRTTNDGILRRGCPEFSSERSQVLDYGVEAA
jgi:hypothetical protein